jgi:hypothetical protein
MAILANDNHYKMNFASILWLLATLSGKMETGFACWKDAQKRR